MFSRRGRCHKQDKDLTGFRVSNLSGLLLLNTQTAFGLPKPQTVCKGECNAYYMCGHKWSLNET